MKTNHDAAGPQGIILINKPQHLTSNAVLKQVKRLFGAKKAGHTGSLDPLATGMLPICLGEATKISQFLLNANKCYEVTGLLGVQTDTGDAMGQVIATSQPFTITEQALKETLARFKGPIQQIPPMFSALKHQGKPLYRLARAGIVIERKPRDVFIEKLILNAFDGERMMLRVNCSKGTYIRSLVEDIGHQLGVGAHVTQLHRCYTAGFEQEPMYTLQDLQDKDEHTLQGYLLPMEYALKTIPKIYLTSEQARLIYQGRVLSASAFNNTQEVNLQSVQSLGQDPTHESDEGLALAQHCQQNHDNADRADIVGVVQLYVDHHFIGLGELDSAGALKAKRLLQQCD